ncbi:hypothetical protein MGYG_07135 [Nannizzia gypsea CBS 118893]|uniref:Uncharacterized protein n=1 Tax=Arthroderma gypseum (strain ATCC MYA-4604 / CBS 118893) TaxID=535722 RepID=E4V263_ARTGP|nr:hypothetical protein MGYG_07135 [Nannizzia gypsea CBS 118893]EFR04128.1 hypothetical protein MGYG_07135 [Nannizzia gypsea CBS 118893]
MPIARQLKGNKIHIFLMQRFNRQVSIQNRIASKQRLYHLGVSRVAWFALVRLLRVIRLNEGFIAIPDTGWDVFIITTMVVVERASVKLCITVRSISTCAWRRNSEAEYLLNSFLVRSAGYLVFVD